MWFLLKKISKFIDSISEWSGRILCSFLMLIMLFLIYEVVLRYFFDSPTIWAHESSQIFFGIYGIGLGAYALLHKFHVRMDVIYSLLSPKKKAIIDIVTAPIIFFWSGLLLIYGAKFAYFSISMWEHSTSVWSPPIWPLKLMIPFSALLIILQAFADLVHNIEILVEGKSNEH
jgi:TRAP-type mannitol/chloroaromatic compound transport system permease small subunit